MTDCKYEPLKSLYSQWLTAAAKRDEQWYLRHLAEDFVYIGLGAGSMNRSELIEANNTGENGEYSLLDFQSKNFGELWQCWGTYSARCDIPEQVPLNDKLKKAYAQGCQLAFVNCWVSREVGLQCISHATVLID